MPLTRRVVPAWLFAFATSLYLPVAAAAQAIATDALSVARGQSAIVTSPAQVARVSIGDPEIADAIVVSPREVLVNGRALGSTTLILWDAAGNRRFYSIEVTADAPALQRQIRALFPNEPITITASGNTVVVSGRVSDAGIARRVQEIVAASGATVVQNLSIPPARQVLLRVRFAEVSRNAARQLGTSFRVGETGLNLNPDNIVRGGDRVGEVFSGEGIVRLFLFEDNIQVNAVIQALKSRSLFKSLAEPNLLAIEGAEASFLAGGEFPYPVPGGGGAAGNNVTIVFKEFGIRLAFRPTITVAGNIRMTVAPEVSSLDFSNGLTVQGFRVPSLLTRRAATEVELRPGQTFAIAGLMDNTSLYSINKIPVLGDIPILGELFRSRDVRQGKTELLVLVTPELVQPLDQAPPVPTGEPEQWNVDRSLRGPVPPRRTAPPATF